MGESWRAIGSHNFFSPDPSPSFQNADRKHIADMAPVGLSCSSFIYVLVYVFFKLSTVVKIVGPVAPERILKWRGGTGIFLVVPFNFVGSKSTISRFGERFRDGQYSLASFLFAVFLLTVPRVQPFVKVGEGDPRALWSRRQCV